MILKNTFLYLLLSLVTYGIIPISNSDFIYEDVLYKSSNLLNSTTVPLKKAGNLLLVDATVDGVSGVFVLDTGAPGLVLNETYFREGMPTYGASGGGITGNKIKRTTKKVKIFEFSGLVFENIKADVINLRHIENAKGVKVLGLIGAKFINDFEVIIDTRKMSMKMVVVDRKGEYVEPYKDENVYDIEQKAMLFNNVVVSYIPIGGKKVCFCLDTGAERNIIDNQSHKDILEKVSITGRSRIHGASSEKVEVLYGTMNDFSISGHSLKGLNVILMDLSIMRQSFGINVGGMLGHDFFAMGVIKINLRKKIMSIALYD